MSRVRTIYMLQTRFHQPWEDISTNPKSLSHKAETISLSSYKMKHYSNKGHEQQQHLLSHEIQWDMRKHCKQEKLLNTRRAQEHSADGRII